MQAPEAETPAAQPQANNDWYWGGQSAVPEEPLPPIGATAPAVSEEEIPDWLKSMQADAPAAEPPLAFTPAPEPAAPPAADVPDWLKAMQAPAEAPEPAPSFAPPSAPASETPSWMATPEAPAEDMPDWLKSMPATGAFTTSGPSEASAPAENLPDWLKSADEPAATPLPPSITGRLGASEPARPQPAFSLPDETPDWMRDIGGPLPGSSGSGGTAALSMDAPLPAIMPGAEETVDFLSSAAPAPEEEAPDWLSSLGISSASAGDVPAPPAPTPTPSADTPDWLKEFTGGTSALRPAAGEPSEAPGALPGEEPDWLQSLRSETGTTDEALASALPFGSAISPFSADDEGDVPLEAAPVALTTPDWLAGLRPVEPIEPSPFEEAPAGAPGDLAQGELPNWLSAMRPVEAQHAALSPEVDDYEESVGVLAGMKGVLRAEPSVVLPGKSAANVQTLVFTDTHSSQAKLLATLVRPDALAGAAARPGLKLPTVPWDRWLIVVVLVIGMSLPFFVDNLFLLPTGSRLATQAAFLTMEQTVTNAKPVLIAFDYEPAQNGELRPGARVLIEHLMRRGVPIVALSTNLVGGNLAQDLLADPEADAPLAARHSYSDTLHYLNLGYLPGGATGILQFAAAPRSAFRADFAGRDNPGTQPILQNIQGLKDFGALVIISAAPEDARAWIEQTQSIAPDVPIVLVISAGADPLLRPYFEPLTGSVTRVKGVVSGLIGAAHYEQQALRVGATRNFGPALQNWSVLGSGLLTAAFVLLVGNLIHGAAGVMLRRRKG